ncbi:MAG: hypothetical protein WCG87_00195 [Bacteroidota bacterium]
MCINEMPQGSQNFNDGNPKPKLIYAIGEDGNYVEIPVIGQQAQQIAQQTSWDNNGNTLAEIEAKVKAGELSPIAYYMEKYSMDIANVALELGKWEWQVKKHLNPSAFKELSPAVIQAYANIFHITFATLVHFGDEESGS